MKFRIMHGTHTDTDRATGRDRVWRTNEVVETDQDLRLLNGSGGMSPKYQLLDGSPEVQANQGDPKSDRVEGMR